MTKICTKKELNDLQPLICKPNRVTIKGYNKNCEFRTKIFRSV